MPEGLKKFIESNYITADNSNNLEKNFQLSLEKIKNTKDINKKVKMNNLPEAERPYEKLKMFGAEKLSNAELLAIIIKTGTKTETALDLANKVLKMSNTLEELRDLSITDLKKIDGIGDVKAIELMAVCELTKRMTSNNIVKMQIKSPKDVYKMFEGEMRYRKNEEIKIIILNIKNYVVKVKDIAVGDVNRATVSIKMILSENIRLEEPKLILVHNHPSGNPAPSKGDLELTKKVYKAGNLLGVEVLDHIVIGNGGYKSIFSMQEFQKTLLDEN